MNLFVAWLIGLTILLGLLLVSGCTTIGKGRGVVVQQPSTDELSKKYFGALITTNSEPSLIDLATGTTAEDNLVARLQKHRDRSSLNEVETHFDLSVRDRTSTPPFLPVDTDIRGAVLEVYKKNVDLLVQDDSTTEIQQRITALLTASPDLFPRTTLHHVEDGHKIFYYYPRLQLDFSAQLTSAAASDRFSYLAVLIRLDDATACKENSSKSRIRFLDVSPKESDFVDFSLGTLTQSAQLSAKAALGRTSEDSSSSKQTVEEVESSTTGKRTGNAGVDATWEASDEFARELKSALEKRTLTILEDGRALLIEFRANEDQRIGGTYSFDLVMEVPSDYEASNDFYTTPPITKEIVADVRFVGVVRQVARAGSRGLMVRVPEPLNDLTYEHVITDAKSPPLLLWSHRGIPWTGFKSPTVIKVQTNHGDARYQLVSRTSNEPIAFGSGYLDTITVQTSEKELRIEFLPIHIGTGTNHTELAAQPVDVDVNSTTPMPIHVSAAYAKTNSN